MKQYMAIYIGTATTRANSEWDRMEEGKRKALEMQGMKAWGDWMATHQRAIVDTGGPLGKTKRASAKGVSDTKNEMVGYVILEAESHEAAARMFENHPHFAIFPGEAVEIMEVMPIPGAPG